MAKCLVHLAERDGHAEGDATILELPLTQTELAEMVGGSRQSVNQSLKTFEARGLLDLRGREVAILDLEVAPPPRRAVARARLREVRRTQSGSSTLLHGVRDPAGGPARAAESRKVVAILFADLKGSTEIGERLESEALRRVLTKF